MSRNKEKSSKNRKIDEELLTHILTLLENSQAEVGLGLKDICVEIGVNLSKITWNEDDKDCIRNKHGYRNRAKNEGNKKNKDGAKINFEALQNLKDISDISVLDDVEDIRISLSYLSDQIQYVLGKKSSLEDTDPDKKLVKAISLFHDEQCIIKLKVLIAQDFNAIDLNSKEQRYFLGYNFSQIGELAKELSDYIKPEHSDEATRNPIRFLFGKLGHYRQEIKNNPRILQDKDSKTLLQMKLSFAEFQEDLIKILDLLSKPSKTDVLKVEKENAALIAKLTEKIGQATQNVPKAIKPLEIQKVAFSEKIIALKKELAELEATTGKKEGEESKSNQDIIDFFKQSFIGSKAAKQIKYLVQNYCSLETIERLEIESKYKTFLSQLRSLHESSIEVLADSKKEEVLKNEITKFYSALEKRLKEYNAINKSNITLEDLFAIFKEDDSDNTESERLSKIERVKQDIIRNQKHIEETEEALFSLVIRQKNIEEAAAKHFTEEAEGVEVEPETSSSKENQIINTISEEMKFLRKIQEENHPVFLDGAMKMTIGFVGQYYKELSGIEEVQKYLEDDELFASERVHTTVARHKLMHLPLSNGLEPVGVTVNQHLLPWQESFEALKILLLQSVGAKGLILDCISFSPQYFGNSKKIEDAYIHISLIRSNLRLMKFSDAIAIYASEEVQNFIRAPENNPFLKLEMTSACIDFSIVSGDTARLLQANRMQMDIIEYLLELGDEYHFPRKRYEDMYQGSLTVLLLHNKVIPDPVVIRKIRSDEAKLALADNYLENGRNEEALRIIEPILVKYEEAKTDYLTGLLCYKIMAMYYRCEKDFQKSIEYLEKAESLISQNMPNSSGMVGGYVKYQLLEIKILKCGCYINLPDDSVMEGRVVGKEESIKKALSIGMAAIKEYGTRDDISCLPLADLYAHLALGWYIFNNIKKSDNQFVAKKNASEAKVLIDRIVDSHENMKVCEIWLGLMSIYYFMGDVENLNDALNHARENTFWEICSAQELDWLDSPERELVLLGEGQFS